MFSSLMQALGVDGSFFIQFLIFLCFYPVLSRLLFKPYFQLQNQREKQTSERMQKVEEWKAKKEQLQETYNEKARSLNEEFNIIYQGESKRIKEAFLKKREASQIKIHKECEEKNKALFQEIKALEQGLQSDIPRLAKTAVDHLTS